MSYWWNGGGGGWNGSYWGGSGSYDYYDNTIYENGTVMLADMTNRFGPGEMRTALNNHNEMVQDSFAAYATNQADARAIQQLLSDGNADNDFEAAAILVRNPNVGLEINGTRYFGADALRQLGFAGALQPPAGVYEGNATEGLSNAVHNALQAHVTVYGDGSMSPMQVDWFNSLTRLGAVSGQTINASWNPEAYAQMPASDIQSKEEWAARAAAIAGIDMRSWDPAKGFEHNKQTFMKVYEWYTKVFLEHPELQWAGMAKLAGGVILGAFQQLQSAKDLIPLVAGFDRATAALLAGNITALETRLLMMQQNIFKDMAAQHQAYLNGGIPALQAMRARGEIDDTTLGAWRDIASGDPSLIARGNAALAFREQDTVLRRDYQWISDFRLVPGVESSNLLPQIMSYLAQAPIPNARPFAEAYPNGNVINLDDRMRWINGDVFATWQSFSPQYRATLVNQSLQNLADRQFATAPNEPIPQPHPTPPPMQPIANYNDVPHGDAGFGYEYGGSAYHDYYGGGYYA